MTENEASSGEQGSEEPAGRPSDQALQALPAKVRVHALARIVGSSSREMLAVLARLGVGARSAQSSIDRDTVAQVVDDLFPSETPAVDIVPPADDATPAAEALDPAGLAEPTLDLETPAARTSAAASPAVPAPMFLAPGAESAPARPRRRRASRSSGVVTPTLDEAADETVEEPDAVEAPATPPTSDDEAGESAETGDGSAGDGEDDDEGARRRRRRGRRGRGRGRGPADENGEGDDTDENDGDAATDASGEGSDDDADGSDDGEGADGADDDASSSGSRRRRRRRRRSSEGGGDGAEGSNGSTGPDDPPDTVTHVRDRTEKAEKAEKPASDEVKGVKGSTRLEAKRQRRRDGRDQGRRRPPILSESEFLARREAVERTMIVRQQAGRSQIGVLEDGVLVEHFVAGEGQNSMVGNVYLGRVQNVLPSMEAAFVDIGRGRNAVLYAGEVNWDASGLEGKQRKIEQALSSGDQVLVQVTKDPVGHKGARLTTQISLPGRFLVFVPAGGATGISRKLPDNERKRLKEILKQIVPDESGVIIRTAAEGISEADLERDVNRLTAQWEVIERKAAEAKNAKGTAPTLVYEEPDLLIRVVRDMFNEDFASLVVSGGRAFDTLEGYLSHVAPELSARMTRHTAPQDVFAAYRVDEQLAKALDRKVWLPSGGTLVIDRTEAMTVVDVNTGKFTGSGGNLEETVTRNNLEAAEEVVRQLRLRDIGGMIVIDFIDMVLESNRDLVLRRLTECLGRDRTRHQVSEVTSLGLVQMTRKRVGQGLLDEFSTTCEHCRGRGVIVSTEPVLGDHQHGQGGGQGSSQQAAAGNGQSSGNGGGNGNGGGSGKGDGSGGGSGRRRGRGRRGSQSDGGSPAEVAPGTETTTDVDETDDTPDTVESTREAPAATADATEASAPDAVAADAVAGDEVRVEAEVQEDEAQEATSEPAGSAADEHPVVAQATTEEVALETDLAEHSGAAGEAGESSAHGTAGEAEDEPAARAEEPASVVEPTPVVEDVVEPAVAPVEPAEAHTQAPAEAPAEEKPAARPRRRRAASRPAGPPAAGDAAASGDPATRVEAASASVGGS